MGEPVVFGFLALAALGPLIAGAITRRRSLWASGCALWLALASAWVIGPIGLALGLPLLVLAVWPRRR